MAPDERRCAETTSDGRPCQAPSNLVDPSTGLCPSHAPDAAERLSELGRRGAEAAARRHAAAPIDPDDLPALDGPRAAERWLEAAGRAVASGALSHNAGRTIARIVREWLRARDAGEMADRVEDLEARIAALKRGDLEVLT